MLRFPRFFVAALLRHTPVVALLAACATTGATVDDSGQRQATIYQGHDSPTMYADAARSSTRTFEQAPAAVLAAVRQAFLDYSIPITLDLPAARKMGNTDFYRSTRFMGRPMTELVSCGSGITGPNAATFRIYMSLEVTVNPDPKGGSTAGVRFQATARDVVNGTSNDRLPCGSTGRIEGLLMERIAGALVK